MKVLHSFTIVHDCQSSPFFFHSDEHILAETFKNPRNFSLAIMSRDAMAMASLAFCLRLPRHRRNHRRDRDGDDRDEGTAATAAAMDGRSLGAKAKYHRATGAKVKDVSKIEVPGIPTTIKTMGVNITTNCLPKGFNHRNWANHYFNGGGSAGKCEQWKKPCSYTPEV